VQALKSVLDIEDMVRQLVVTGVCEAVERNECEEEMTAPKGG
jgi:hypothetical protein